MSFLRHDVISAIQNLAVYGGIINHQEGMAIHSYESLLCAACLKRYRLLGRRVSLSSGSGLELSADMDIDNLEDEYIWTAHFYWPRGEDNEVSANLYVFRSAEGGRINANTAAEFELSFRKNGLSLDGCYVKPEDTLPWQKAALCFLQEKIYPLIPNLKEKIKAAAAQGNQAAQILSRDC